MSRGRKPKPNQVCVDLFLPQQLYDRINAYLTDPISGQVKRDRSAITAMLWSQYLDKMEKLDLTDLVEENAS